MSLLEMRKMTVMVTPYFIACVLWLTENSNLNKLWCKISKKATLILKEDIF